MLADSRAHVEERGCQGVPAGLPARYRRAAPGGSPGQCLHPPPWSHAHGTYRTGGAGRPELPVGS